MSALPRSGDAPRARNPRAPACVLVGLLAVASLPAAVLLTRYSERVELLHAGVGIAPAVVLGISALAVARGARLRVERTLGRARGLRLARVGRALGLLALYLAATAGVALAVYAALSRLAD